MIMLTMMIHDMIYVIYNLFDIEVMKLYCFTVKVHWTSLLHRSSGPKEQMSLGRDLGSVSWSSWVIAWVLAVYSGSVAGRP